MLHCGTFPVREALSLVSQLDIFMSISCFDTPERYGRVSRVLHGAMALLLTVQLLGALLHVFARGASLERLLWSNHGSLGFLVLVLAVLRGTWGLVNIGRRPLHTGFLGRLAGVSHLLMHALMILVPFLAVLRAYGRGRGFSPFGVPLFDASGQEIPALITPASTFHGLLAWVLLALIVGHVGAAVYHRVVLKDGVFSRMWGRAH
jgi:cytochrome b561